MQLLLVRHGLPHAAIGNPSEPTPCQGADPGLTDAGHEQAARLAGWLASSPDRPGVAAVAVSPMRRARQTAEPVGASLGILPVVVDGLAEYDRGHHSYRPVHELEADGDPEWSRVRAGLFPTFVDVDAFRARVLETLAGIVAEHPGRETVIVVCHAGVINTYLAEVLGLDRPLVFPLDHVGVTRVLVSRSGQRRVRSVNETQHVAGQP